MVECNRAPELRAENTSGFLGVGIELQQPVEIAHCLHRFYNTLGYKDKYIYKG